MDLSCVNMSNCAYTLHTVVFPLNKRDLSSYIQRRENNRIDNKTQLKSENNYDYNIC